MKRILVFIILTCCASLAAFSQKKVGIDVIYLKTDSILVGNILHTVPEVSLTFKTLNEEFLYIQLTDIKQIRHEKYYWSDGRLIPMPSDSLNTKFRYWFWLQGGGRLELGDTKSLHPQIDMVHGIQKQSKLRLGIGIGARFLEDKDLFLVPVYLHLQTASNKKVAPMAAIGAGMVSNPKSEWKFKGPFLRGDIGMQATLESGGFFTLTIGFEQMNFFTNDALHNATNTVNSLTLNVGIMF